MPWEDHFTKHLVAGDHNVPTFLDKAKALTPGGSQTSSRRHGKVGTIDYPAFAVEAAGAYIYFSKTDRAIDLAGANATCPLGANHPRVLEAVLSQLGKGGTMSLPAELEVSVSEQMLNVVPYNDRMVRWVRTGSEGMSAAVAIALQATGRARVGVRVGSYHGWHTWTRDICTPIPESTLPERRLLETLAAYCIESPRWTEVDAKYKRWVASIRKLCDETGTLLIFDDVVHAFRFESGGLQQSSGVPADLAVFSKALGNGVPVACVVGKKDLMQQTEYRVSSTFGGETLGLAAAGAVLQLHQTQDVCGQLRQVGVDLRERLLDAIDGTGIKLVGCPQHFRFEADTDTPDTPLDDRFLTACIYDSQHPVLVHRDANNVNLAMDEYVRENIAATIKRAAHNLESEVFRSHERGSDYEGG
jgi:glutamate-1-semialdehyde 2,1-aminomutase